MDLLEKFEKKKKTKPCSQTYQSHLWYLGTFNTNYIIIIRNVEILNKCFSKNFLFWVKENKESFFKILKFKMFPHGTFKIKLVILH